MTTANSGHTDDGFSSIVYNEMPVFRVELEHMIVFVLTVDCPKQALSSQKLFVFQARG
jgi:hypothetical protein